MNWLTYHRRSANFHWKSHLWVALAVAVATAVLTGALVVGDSMRGSLRELAVGRLGSVDYAVVSPRLFEADLAERIRRADDVGESVVESACSLLLLRGSATHAKSRARAGRVSIFGVDDAFWSMDAGRPAGEAVADRRSIVLNGPLAAELGAAVGDDIVLHLGKPNAISTETLLGRRDDTTATLRLTVAAVLPPRGLAAFDLNPRQGYPQNAFVSRETLQRALDQPGRANVLLLAGVGGTTESDPSGVRVRLERALTEALRPADLGLTLRADDTSTLVIESDALLIEPAHETLVLDIARSENAPASRFLAYLANAVTRPGGGRPTLIPYSAVVAVDPESAWMAQLAAESGAKLGDGGILLNEWAARDLDASAGDAIELTYYVTGDDGSLQTRSAAFRLDGVVPMDGAAADPGLVPPYRGVTDARSLADWDPPFPLDLALIRDKDEEYWDAHRTTPKAFLRLADGERLWAKDGERFGRVTSIRLAVADAGEFASRWAAMPAGRIDPDSFGLSLQPIREQMTAAASGPTDFGTLFLSFSFFLIASAAMLVALLFRLGVERRTFEVGLLLAEGFTPRAAGRFLLVEGLLVSLAGTLPGIAGAAGFAGLMLTGLTSWWSAAVNAPMLSLHILPGTLALGACISLTLALGSIAGSVRGVTRRSARSLLAGETGDDRRDRVAGPRIARTFFAVAGAVLIGSIALGTAASAMTRALAFFAAGASALTLALLVLKEWLRARPREAIAAGGPSAWVRLGVQSAKRNHRRSLLTAGLIASAAFLIVSLEAFRLDPDSGHDRNSGSGGFAWYAEAAIPLPYDLRTADGRENLGVTDESLAALSVSSFRLRPGEDSSCTNLYRPTRPRILGADDSFLERGGFAFAESLARTEAEQQNPWLLLHRRFDDGAIPAIADANPVRWQYHLGLGRDLVIPDQNGRDVRLRFVALLSNSVLQDELIVAEESFLRLFPSLSGRAFFLIEPNERVFQLEATIERELEPFGFDAATTASRLRSYFAVQNTYIRTFQSLGALGFLLGAAGLAAVMARNVWERRRELALMRATGFTRTSLGVVVMSENMALVAAGLIAGAAAATLAVAPMVAEGQSLPLLRLAVIFVAVFLAGLVAGLAAVSRALRAPLIPSLRNE